MITKNVIIINVLIRIVFYIYFDQMFVTRCYKGYNGYRNMIKPKNYLLNDYSFLGFM